jgi:hypothetical protein
MNDKNTYKLKEGINRVVRPGLVLEGDETIEAYPDLWVDNQDVLTKVNE